MENLRRILAEFIDMGVKHAFRLEKGHFYQGYPFEIDGDTLLMWDSGPMAAKGQLEVPIAEIDLTTLSYWDEARGAWMDARWDEEEDRWILTQVAGQMIPAASGPEQAKPGNSHEAASSDGPRGNVLETVIRPAFARLFNIIANR